METFNGNSFKHPVNAGRYAFDEFEVDPANRTCTRAGAKLPMTGKVFDVLLSFVQNPGRLLLKSELIESVWPSEFVEEGNLARNVSTLRKLLGDSGTEHRYIVTVPGHGYRFIAEVTAEPDTKDDASDIKDRDVAHQVSAVTDTPRSPTRRSFAERLYRRPIFLLVFIACLVLAVLLAFSLSKRRLTLADTLSFDRLQQTVLTQDGDVFEPFISPDGKYLAYVRINGRDRSLCLRQLATGSVLELRPPEQGATYWAVAFSPDDEFLYYIMKDSDPDYGSVYRLPLIGQQTPVKLAERANGGLTISPNGKYAAFTRGDREAGQAYIVTVSTTGENEQVVSSTDYDSTYYSLDWSPDGRSLLYSRKERTDSSQDWYIAEIPAVGGPELRIGAALPNPVVAARWLSDKSGIIVNAVDDVTHKPQIFTMSYPDGTLRRVTHDMNSYVGFSVTSDGRTIVVPQINSNRQIWSISQPDAAPVKVSAGTKKHFDSVAWLSDDTIVFDTDEDGSFTNYNIYSMRADGSDVRQLTFGPGSNSNPTVSADGRTIAFVSNRSGTKQLWKMDADGRNLQQLTHSAADVLRPVFLPDGDHVLYSVYASGAASIWMISIEGGKPVLVTGRNVDVWSVSPDGTRLAFSAIDPVTRAEKTHIQLIGSENDEEVLPVSPETWLEWGADGRSLYFNTPQDGGANIWKASLDQKTVSPVSDFRDEQVLRFAWSQHGKTLACIRHETTYDALIMHFE